MGMGAKALEAVKAGILGLFCRGLRRFGITGSRTFGIGELQFVFTSNVFEHVSCFV